MGGEDGSSGSSTECLLSAAPFSSRANLPRCLLPKRLGVAAKAWTKLRDESALLFTLRIRRPLKKLSIPGKLGSELAVNAALMIVSKLLPTTGLP